MVLVFYLSIDSKPPDLSVQEQFFLILGPKWVPKGFGH